MAKQPPRTSVPRGWVIVAVVALLSGGAGNSARAATLHVPRDHKTIQAAVDAAAPGDTVLVEPGTYREKLRLKERVIVKSAGGDTQGKVGLKRAEATILDGGGDGKQSGVVLAEGAVLDGFSVMNVGLYDEAVWNKHHATHGEVLPDEQGAAGSGSAAIAVPGVNGAVSNNIVHHNGNAGIVIQGSKGKNVTPHIFRNVVQRNMGGGIGSLDGSRAVIEENVCSWNLRSGIGSRNASPLILNNTCYENIRAGIGNREGATPTIRGNKCYQNRRAGIGSRMKGTNPIVEANECYENDMAGIGSRDGAAPVIRNNRCYKNKMAGIGSRDGARPIIENNDCFENEMAGIGSRNGAAPIIRDNRCYKNQMAGIGSRDGARPIIDNNDCHENQMAGIGSRDGAVPIIRNNRCGKNEMAGIGARLGARPVITDNDCFENQLAGIGSREGAVAVIHNNRCTKNDMAGIGSREGARCLIEGNDCRENKQAGIGARHKAVVAILNNRCTENGKVAVGLRQQTIAHVAGNELVRTGGKPPMIAVGEESKAVIAGNTIRGGGVCGILVEGSARILGNRMEGNGDKSGSAVWALAKSDVTQAGNRADRYRNLIQNDRKEAGKEEDPQAAASRFWAVQPDQWKAEWLPPEQAISPTSVQEGSWKLVVVNDHGKTIYQLFNLAGDPQEKKDLSAQMDHRVFRLRGLLERREAGAFKNKVRGESPGK